MSGVSAKSGVSERVQSVLSVVAGFLPVLYDAGKDANKWAHAKAKYSRNLADNYHQLHQKLEELLGLIIDINASEENSRYIWMRFRTNTRQAWLSTASKIKEQAEDLVHKYETLSVPESDIRKRASLSKKIEKKYIELNEHVQEGIQLMMP